MRIIDGKLGNLSSSDVQKLMIKNWKDRLTLLNENKYPFEQSLYVNTNLEINLKYRIFMI